MLSFASLSVRPLYYALLADHVLTLDYQSLRPIVKSIILCLLPGLEDETSEDFEQGIELLDKLRAITTQVDQTDEQDGGTDGYFWQCFFLAVITSPPRRQGALSYMFRWLPSLGPYIPSTNGGHNDGVDESVTVAKYLSPAAEAILRPEPGLLIRCFVVGLKDDQMLVQRGFLDLLATRLPLHSPALQVTAEGRDLEQLVAAAVSVVLRRDMSLNRRLWTWLLGPDAVSSGTAGADQPKSPISPSSEDTSEKAGSYFRQFGHVPMKQCILAMFDHASSSPSERARPYRICLSLMDRWEIGSILVPDILMPSLRSVFDHAEHDRKRPADEVIRSASLFFDGVESELIWSNLIMYLLTTLQLEAEDAHLAKQQLRFLDFVINRFNLREEDMLTVHIPNAILLSLDGLHKTINRMGDEYHDFFTGFLQLIDVLVSLVPDHAFYDRNLPRHAATATPPQLLDADSKGDMIYDQLKRHYSSHQETSSGHSPQIMASQRGLLILRSLVDIYNTTSARPELTSGLPLLANMLYAMIPKVHEVDPSLAAKLVSTSSRTLKRLVEPESSPVQAFTMVSSTIGLLAAFKKADPASSLQVDSENETLQPMFLDFLWHRLSPTDPKYHVEAVRLIWQLEHLAASEQRLAAQLSTFLFERLDTTADSAEECSRFATLWEHSVTSQPSRSERRPNTLTRRTSSFSAAHDFNARNAEQILLRPLLLLLDKLQDETSETAIFLHSWIQRLPSLDKIFSILFTLIEAECQSYEDASIRHGAQSRRQRYAGQAARDLARTHKHMLNILKHASSHTWSVLTSIQPKNPMGQAPPPNGTHFLALSCIKALKMRTDSPALHLEQLALETLQILLESPSATILKALEIEDALIDQLTQKLDRYSGSIQTEYLRAITKALRVRTYEPPSDADSPPSSSHGSMSVLASMGPPSRLLSCISKGLSSPHCRLFLDHWVEFLSTILPLYADAIFTAMIPLVECFCKQISLAFQHLINSSSASPYHRDEIPVTALPALLHGLEMVLANAHLRLASTVSTKPAMRPPDQNQNFFGNMVSGVFTADGPPSRTSGVNNRLTVILCMQDAVRTCFEIWVWATLGMDLGKHDPTSVATTNFNSVKLRNRTKKILENLFVAESLECLEALMLLWLKGNGGSYNFGGPSSTFSLLHTLTATQPRNIVPVMLNALYSRTNIEALDKSRRSTLTCDLSGPDVAVFMHDYLGTVEDDAMDEIWEDFTTFFRDVLSNPMPHRKILPIALELAVLLAQKIDNTNYGELRKMQRDLAVSSST